MARWDDAEQVWVSSESGVRSQDCKFNKVGNKCEVSEEQTSMASWKENVISLGDLASPQALMPVMLQAQPAIHSIVVVTYPHHVNIPGDTASQASLYPKRSRYPVSVVGQARATRDVIKR